MWEGLKPFTAETQRDHAESRRDLKGLLCVNSAALLRASAVSRPFRHTRPSVGINARETFESSSTS